MWLDLLHRWLAYLGFVYFSYRCIGPSTANNSRASSSSTSVIARCDCGAGPQGTVASGASLSLPIVQCSAVRILIFSGFVKFQRDVLPRIPRRYLLDLYFCVAIGPYRSAHWVSPASSMLFSALKILHGWVHFRRLLHRQSRDMNLLLQRNLLLP